MSTIDLTNHGSLSGAQRDANALVPAHGGMEMVPSQPWFTGYAPRPEIIVEKPKPVTLWHAFRRRWLLASGLGLLLASLLMALVYFLLPVRYESFAYMTIVEAAPAGYGGTAATSFDTYKRSQQQKVKSPPVLDAVMRNRDFARLSEVTKQNPETINKWLEKNLNVDFPGNGEIMKISFRAEKPAEAKAIVDEVVAEYMVNVVEKDKYENANKVINLDRQVTAKREEQKKANDELDRRKSAMFVAGGEVGAEFAKQRYISEVQNKTAIYYRYQHELAEVELKIKGLEIRAGAKSKESQTNIPELTIKDKIDADSQITKLRNKIDEIDEQYARLAGAQSSPLAAKRQSPKLDQMRRQRDSLVSQLEEREAELAPLVIEQLRSGGGIDRSEEDLAILRAQQKDLTTRMADAEKEMNDVVAKANKFNTNSSSIQEKESEVKAITAALDILDRDLQMTKAMQMIDETSLQRVRKYTESATLPKVSDAWMKYLTMIFAGLIGFGGCALGVAILEFQKRRLNHPGEVSEGLSIPVMGYLPKLSGKTYRKMQTERGAVLRSQLYDSIDSIRSALLYDAKSESCKVILVTSADCQEGKTTVACQLAASLARSGRKTLLVDGDLRRPSAHRVFDAPEAPGLAEVLRGQIECAATVVPTEQPNLWILPAGYVDQNCIQTLGSGGMAKILEALQLEYEYVIIDAGAVLQVADPMIIGQSVDAAILAVQRDTSSIPQIYEAYERLRSVGVTVLGTVVNGVSRQVRSLTTHVTSTVVDPNLVEEEHATVENE